MRETKWRFKCMGNDGKLLEELIYNKYQSEATEITTINEEYEMVRRYVVKKNFQAQDFRTEETRQVDVAIFINSYEGERFIAIECKDHKEKIDVQELESFITKLISIRASKGIMVSTSGFTGGALKLARSSLGINLKLMTIDQLSEYLYHDYKYYNGECPLCKNKKSWTGEKIDSIVLYNNFDNVITKKGKYLKIYNGSCSECHTINFLNEKCGSITPLFYLGNNCNYYWNESEIPCRDNCGLIYVIDKHGNVGYRYKDKMCDIINSGHVDF